jgi:hypothetical protein
MSRRTVHFAANELVREFFEDSWCECTPPQTKTCTPYRPKIDHSLLLTTEEGYGRKVARDSRRVFGS